MKKRSDSKRRDKNKRAISPIIATTLLIVLVIIIALIILLWARGFIKEKILKFEKPVENVCGEVSLRTFVNDDDTFGFTNIGNVPIHSVDLQLSTGGSTDIERIEDSDNDLADIGISHEFSSSDYTGYQSYSSYTKVKIIPILKGKTKSGGIKEYTCSEKNAFEI